MTLWAELYERTDQSELVNMARRRREDTEVEADQHLHKPQQRHAANARERSRMRVLSKAFSRLKVSHVSFAYIEEK